MRGCLGCCTDLKVHHTQWEPSPRYLVVKTKKKGEGLPYVIKVYWLFLTFHGTWERNWRGEIVVRGLDWIEVALIPYLTCKEKRLEVELVVVSNHIPILKLVFGLFFNLKTYKLSTMMARSWRRPLLCIAYVSNE